MNSSNNNNLQQQKCTSDNIDGLKVKENVQQQVILTQPNTMNSSLNGVVPASPTTPFQSPSQFFTGTVSAPLENSTTPKKKTVARCGHCSKRIGLSGGLPCKCERVFCAACRDPFDHACTFDFKSAAKAKIRQNNPKVEAAKINKI